MNNDSSHLLDFILFDHEIWDAKPRKNTIYTKKKVLYFMK
jgi:hypothetical protein